MFQFSRLAVLGPSIKRLVVVGRVALAGVGCWGGVGWFWDTPVYFERSTVIEPPADGDDMVLALRGPAWSTCNRVGEAGGILRSPALLLSTTPQSFIEGWLR